jgi:hypothetical protein
VALDWFKDKDRERVPVIIDAFAKSAPGTGLSFVGMNLSPLTVQLSCSLKGYETLRRLFLTRKIPGHKEFRWNAIEPLDTATASRPLQAPFCLSEDEALPANFQSVVCHLARIAGLEDIAVRAKEIVGDSTSDLSNCKVYLQFGRNGGLYAQSNYIKEGCEYTTKLFISKWMPLFVVFSNLVSHEAVDEMELKELENAHVNLVKYFIAEQDLPRTIYEFFCGAQNVEFVSSFVAKSAF